MIEYIIKSDKGKLKKTKEYKKGCWVNVTNPNEEERDFLIKKFKLKKEDVIDGLDIHESPRFEIEKKKVYIFLTVPTEKIKHEDMSSFLLIYTKDDVITISKYNLEIFDRIIENYKKVILFTNSRNLLRILFFVSRTFDISVRKIRKDVRINKADLNKLDSKDIARLINHENKLNNYISSFDQIIKNYNKILLTKMISFKEEDEGRLEDLINDLNESLNLCKSTQKTIKNMRDYYSTKISTDLNKTVTILTIFTIFLTIPTLIASIYGMNISLPLQNSPNILYILGGFLGGIWVLMIFILKKLKVI